jgi:CBS domain-containing protein
MKRIRDLSTGAVTIESTDNLRQASRELAGDNIGSLIVSDSRGCVGILTERDLTRAIADEVDLDTTTVEEYMTESPIEVDRNGAIGDAIAKMNEYEVRHLVVTEDGNNVVGVVSMRDIFGLLGTGWPEL